MAEGGKKLSEEEIYECLKSLNVPVRMNDLKTPTREFIVRVFECFIKDLQIDIHSYEFKTWEATSHIEELDLYEEAQFLILLAMLVNHIISPLGLNVTIRDILEPKPKRTKKILNYLLVFWIYYGRKYARFRDIEEAFEVEKQKMEQLMLENESLDEKYEEMVNILGNMQPSKEELLHTVVENEKKLTELQKQSDTLQSDYQELKTKESNLQHQICDIDVEIVTAKERIEELNRLIISSPEKIESGIQTLKNKIRAEDVKIKEKENKIKDAEKRVQIQEKSLKEAEECLAIFQNINEELEYLRDAVESIVISQKNVDSEEEEVKKLTIKLELKQEVKLQQDQKSVKVVLNARKQKETLMQALKILIEEEANIRSNIELQKSDISDLKQNIDSVSDSVLEVMKAIKETSNKTEERKMLYFSYLNKYRDNFRYDCESLIEEVMGKLK